MHYTGMAAMQMPGVTISYSAPIVGLSIAIAIAAATAALWLAFRTEQRWQRLASAALMGAAISGMHYTGMAAAHFQMDGNMSRFRAAFRRCSLAGLPWRSFSRR